MKKTKIVATIGPSCDSVTDITDLIKAGVNVFRFNMKHGTIDWHEERIKRVQSIAERLHTTVGVLIDLQGPEIRIRTKNGEKIEIKKGEDILFSTKFVEGEPSIVIPQKEVFEVLKKEDTILIDDGFQEFTILGVGDERVRAYAHDNYVISDRKGVNLPGKHLNLPSLTAEDLLKLILAKKANVDYVALSFSRTKEDIHILKREMKKRGVSASIIAKIESQQALDHLDELILEADGIMVARGDLGVEVPFEQLAFWQNVITEKCRQAAKPVIVATQMLQSMVENTRPTRAEATDVANAVLLGADAVMLSGETANGKHPLKAVQTMARIVKFNEGRENNFQPIIASDSHTRLVVDAAMSMIRANHGPEVDSIVVFTQTGYTARLVSRYRPNIQIIALTDNERAVKDMSLYYGVEAIKVNFPTGEFSLPKDIIKQLKRKKLVTSGKNIVVIHGQHWKKPGQTNALLLLRS